MERNEEQPVALIDLGAASVETQGNGGLEIEPIGMQKPAGLSDDD